MNISSNNIGALVLPEGWTKDDSEFFNVKYVHADGREQKQHPGKPEGAIALADGIKNNGALETITFGDKQAVTMQTNMTEADLSDGKELGASGAIIVAAFLPKCQ